MKNALTLALAILLSLSALSAFGAVPTVAISAPSAAYTATASVTYTITYSGATGVTLATGKITLNTTGTASGTLGVSGTGTATRTVTISSPTGNGTLGITIAAGTSTNGDGADIGPPGASTTFIVDNTKPVVAVSAPSSLYATAGPITYTVSFSDTGGSGVAGITLATTNVTLNATGTASGTMAISGTSLSSRTVTISSITGDGTLGITIASAIAADNAGNTSNASSASATFTVDNTKPTVSIGAPSAAYVNTGQISYTVTYADSGSGLGAITLATTSITLNATGTANGSMAVSGTGASTRTITLSNFTGDGTLGITVGAATVADLAGNTNNASSASTTFIVDNTSPSVAISSPSAGSTATGPITYTVTYTDSGSGLAGITLATTNITLNASAGGTATGQLAVSGTGASTRTVTISNIVGNGTLGIAVGPGTALDNAGNLAAASTNSTTFTVTNTVPSIANAPDYVRAWAQGTGTLNVLVPLSSAYASEIVGIYWHCSGYSNSYLLSMTAIAATTGNWVSMADNAGLSATSNAVISLGGSAADVFIGEQAGYVFEPGTSLNFNRGNNSDNWTLVVIYRPLKPTNNPRF